MRRKYVFYILTFLILFFTYVRLNMYEYRKEDFVFYRINRITGKISAKIAFHSEWISLEIISDSSKAETKEKKPEKAVSPNPFAEGNHYLKLLKKDSVQTDSIDYELLDRDLKSPKKDSSEIGK